MITFGIIVLVIFLVICTLCLIPGYTSSIKDEQGNILQGCIASLEKVNLGGQEQWILIRGVDSTKPVILFLHGGPGTADMGILRKYMRELEKHFVVVTWDQRGAGKSFSAGKPESSMTIEQFLTDAYELTKMLCTRFKKGKIFLAGHSWGSVIGILSVKNHPDLYEAYIGIGQVANMKEGERLSYEWTLEQAKNANDKQAIKTLNEIGVPPYTGKWQKKLITERRYLGKYGGELYGSSKGAFSIVIGCLIRSTEYSLIDKVNFFRGIFASIRLIWPELMTINFMEQAPSLKVPVYFVLGKHDYEVPFKVAEKYFEVLEAPHKELIWFENSAHFPNVEENEKYVDLLVNRILPLTFKE
jgi:pimeloyl-ACP methyl ester carboxylesterase